VRTTPPRNGELPVNRFIPRPKVGNTNHTSASRLAQFLACGLMGIVLAFFLISCGGNTGSETASTVPPAGAFPSPPAGAFPSKKPAQVDTGPKTPADDLAAKLNKVLNEESIRYGPLEYEYDENLLTTIDKAEAYLSGRPKGPAPRAMPKLSELEEYDHIRETIRRWRATTGKDLRAEIDRLKAEVAARQPGGPAYHPDFHKKFAAVFDSFIPMEVQEIRERRNRAIHVAAKPLFEKYRATAPDLVTKYEEALNAPPYQLTPHTPREPAAKSSSPPKT
jgi:hypothetical protein